MSFAVESDDLRRIVVSIDPAATSNEDSDDTGIIVVARGPHQPSTCKLDVHCPGHGYVLDDATCHLSPTGWAKEAIRMCDKWHADRVVAEVNNGGDMVGTVIHAIRADIPYATVNAHKGKFTRAEPVSALYEQGRVHHMGNFLELEQQMESWTPDDDWSPDRVDALVWGLTYLGLVGSQGNAFLTFWKDQQKENEKVAAHAAADPIQQLPRLDDNNLEEHSCVCPSGQRRFFDGICVVCGGRPK
jgi:phage terminase large subunit-like protein